jgi:nitroreductase
MDMQGLYAGCRTYRRFKQEPIPKEILEKIVNTAR